MQQMNVVHVASDELDHTHFLCSVLMCMHAHVMKTLDLYSWLNVIFGVLLMELRYSCQSTSTPSPFNLHSGTYTAEHLTQRNMTNCKQSEIEIRLKGNSIKLQHTCV